MELAQRKRAGDCENICKPAPLVKTASPVAAGKSGACELPRASKKGFGAMLSFELDGDEETRRFWRAVAVSL